MCLLYCRSLARGSGGTFQRLISLSNQVFFIRQTLLQAGQFSPPARANFAQPVLTQLELIIAENPGQEPGTVGRPHRTHHGELFLTCEIGVEELLAIQSQHSCYTTANLLLADGYRIDLVVLKELRLVHAPGHAEFVGSNPKIHLDTNLRSSWSTMTANRISASTSCRVPVKSPCDCLEERRFSRTIRAHNCGDARAEFDLGIRMLAEVDEFDPMELHLFLQQIPFNFVHVILAQRQ